MSILHSEKAVDTDGMIFVQTAELSEVPAVTLLKLTDVVALPWREQPERVFDRASVKACLKRRRRQRDMRVQRRMQFERFRLA